MLHVVSLNDPNDFDRENAVMELYLLPEKFKGYWKSKAPTTWFRQAQASGYI